MQTRKKYVEVDVGNGKYEDYRKRDSIRKIYTDRIFKSINVGDRVEISTRPEDRKKVSRKYYAVVVNKYEHYVTVREKGKSSTFCITKNDLIAGSVKIGVEGKVAI